MSKTLRAASLVALVLGGTATVPEPARAQFVTFETGQVRPLAISPDGTRLFAVNTPDDRLEIFSLGPGGVTHTASVPVGLEPTAVAARTNGEVWVVNHLSDSVSIVDVASTPPRVTRTLLTCDEPRDIVFAGPGGNRAFITTARRGQNCSVPANLTTEGEERALVQVFDATNLGAALGGTPLTTVELFSDTPRALAVAPGGGTVYAAAFHSGNQTTALSEGLVCNGGAGAGSCTIEGTTTVPGGLPAPNTNFEGIPQREVGLIVRFNEGANQWRDELGRNWSNAVRFSLPDTDVFAIDANAGTPAQTASWAHVGTVLFNMIVNPANGKVYVTNTDAHNEVRFEGPGTFFGSTTVQGHLHEARVTVLDGANVLPRHLNKHINYAVRPAPAGIKANSLATPLDMAVNAAGTTLYVAAFGSSKVGIFNTAQLEANTFTPSAANHITVSGGGPSGLVLDEARGRLYVLTRFDNAVSVIDTGTHFETQHVTLHNPEPASVQDGRPVLYDAMLTSSNGEAACAACHVFGDFDSLAWDLGNPDDVFADNPNPILVPGGNPDFHPLKGPMTTQSLRGMANHGPMHWRGDRTGGYVGQPLNEDLAFKEFIVAFEGLLGNNGPISDPDMDRFTDFILQVTYPPNPIKPLANAHSAAGQAGRNFYFGPVSDAIFNCNGCHVLDPAQGFFGGSGQTTFEAETQLFKVPHLRNIYQKVGMFGMPDVPGMRSGNNGNQGPQVRGFGFLHDGSVDTTFRFHRADVFSTSVTDAQNLEQFMFEFDSNLAPIVGQQITLTSANAATVGPRIDLMLARDSANECEVVVKGTIAGLQRGAYRLANGLFQPDRVAESDLSDAQLRSLAATPGQELTYTCAPPGSGQRMGVDRDGDGFFDRDEIDAGSDPADPFSIPGGTTTTTTSTTTSTSGGSTTSTTTGGSTTTTTIPPAFNGTLIPTSKLSLRDDNVPPADATKRKITFKSSTRNAAPANRITPEPPGSTGDPTQLFGTVVVYNSSGLTTDLAAVALQSTGWSAIGSGSSFKGYRWSNRLDPANPIQSVKVLKDVIVLKGRGPFFDYSLDEAAQGRVAIRVALGTSTAFCADAPPRTSGNPPSTAQNDRPDRFDAKDAPAPASCPPLPFE